jgi:hypothetical protein
MDKLTNRFRDLNSPSSGLHQLFKSSESIYNTCWCCSNPEINNFNFFNCFKIIICAWSVYTEFQVSSSHSHLVQGLFLVFPKTFLPKYFEILSIKLAQVVIEIMRPTKHLLSKILQSTINKKSTK